ncbi:MAG TPA: ABC transporter ATP-binding protein [Aliidongia sp.]|uniref:ABC transporter ATP-binding protein n=1 Tax=Aliidongia sp. TaxID=1914230 RepID=UPI002DDCF145|nr:ABC transporter ATP-binding protein [Aliidongia sp.]HEV2677695.1 ABC transporter ATP-binding protein [Aliidongia sp.]
MTAIRIENIVKRWGDTAALDDVSFEAPEGSLTVLLGPSGCGKSTLLRILAGLDTVTAGRIFIGGTDVTERPPSQRKIAMVFQSYALFPHLSVGENIVFGLHVRKVPREERQRRLDATAGLLGLGDLLARKPGQLSGGQQQRVAIGRAIIAEAPICLMDEPMSNLDAKLRAEMRVEIHALQRKLGITMVYVTHDQVEAMSMADQVVLLNSGRIEQIASPGDMYAAPASTFVARFIGMPPMNLVALEPLVGDAGMAIAGTTGPRIVGFSRSALTLGLRPEDIVLAESGIPAAVEQIEYLGADTVLKCRAGTQRLLMRVDRRVKAAVGDRVHLAWREDAIHLFDPLTGRTLPRSNWSGSDQARAHALN